MSAGALDREPAGEENSPATSAQDFVPPRLLAGFHPQTLIAALLRCERWHAHPPAEQVLVEVDRETRLSVHVSWQHQREAPALVLVHGLGGSVASPYMRAMARKAHRVGFHVVAVNLRGAGDGRALSRLPYHSGLVADVDAVLSWLSSRSPGPIALTGFSLGGNQVLRLAALEGDGFTSRVAALAAVSPAVDLDACARSLDGQPGARLYRDAFLRELMAMARRFARAGTGAAELEALGRPASLREFDHGWTAPLHGFTGAEDYYRGASALPLLSRLAVPTLIIQSRDDLLVPAAPLEGVPWPGPSPVRRLITERGGHCGFLAARRQTERGVRDDDRFWAENRVLGFLCDRVGWEAPIARRTCRALVD